MEMTVYGTFIMRTLVMGQVEQYLLPLRNNNTVRGILGTKGRIS
jgi:hypothetical protein